MRNAKVRAGAFLLLVPIAWHLPTSLTAFSEAATTAVVTLSVPAEPIPIKAANSIALVYELHIANVGTQPLRLERIVVRRSANKNRRRTARLC